MSFGGNAAGLLGAIQALMDQRPVLVKHMGGHSEDHAETIADALIAGLVAHFFDVATHEDRYPDVKTKRWNTDEVHEQRRIRYGALGTATADA